MNYLGLDFGTKRIGVSVFYGDVGMVLPKEAIVASGENEKFEKIAQIIEQCDIGEIVIGLPLNMDGSEGQKSAEVRAFAQRLKKYLARDIVIHYVDERLTSEQAHQDMRMVAGKKSPKRTIKDRTKGIIDSRAATIILQDFITEKYGNI